MLATDYDDDSATRYVEEYFDFIRGIAEKNAMRRRELLARVCVDFPRPVNHNDAKGVWIIMRGGEVMHLNANVAYRFFPNNHSETFVGFVHNASHVVDSFHENDDTRRVKALWLQGNSFAHIGTHGPYLPLLGESKDYCAPFALSVTCRYSDNKEANRDLFKDYIRFSSGETLFFTHGEDKYGTREHPYVTDLADVCVCEYEGVPVYDQPEPIPLYPYCVAKKIIM